MKIFTKECRFFNRGGIDATAGSKWEKLDQNVYRISSYSFRGNYSFLNLEIQRSQYIRPKVTVHKGAETIQGRKLFKGGNYMRKYGSYLQSVGHHGWPCWRVRQPISVHGQCQCIQCEQQPGLFQAWSWQKRGCCWVRSTQCIWVQAHQVSVQQPFWRYWFAQGPRMKKVNL